MTIQRAQGVKPLSKQPVVEDRSGLERLSLDGYLLQEKEPESYERIGTGTNYRSDVVAGRRRKIR